MDKSNIISINKYKDVKNPPKKLEDLVGELVLVPKVKENEVVRQVGILTEEVIELRFQNSNLKSLLFKSANKIKSLSNRIKKLESK